MCPLPLGSSLQPGIARRGRCRALKEVCLVVKSHGESAEAGLSCEESLVWPE